MLKYFQGLCMDVMNVAHNVGAVRCIGVLYGISEPWLRAKQNRAYQALKSEAYMT